MPHPLTAEHKSNNIYCYLRFIDFSQFSFLSFGSSADFRTYFLCNQSTVTMKLLTIAAIAVTTTLQMAHAASPCVTANECEAKAEELGIVDFYVGDFPSKGCFTKNNKAFFSEGTEEEMSSTGLDGQQKRIWCGGDSSNDLIPMDQLLPVGGSESSSSSAVAGGGLSTFGIVVAAASFGGLLASLSF